MNALAQQVPVTEEATREDDIAAMVVNGQLVMIDTSDFAVDGRQAVVVVEHDGTFSIQNAKLANERSYLGRRTGFYAQAGGVLKGCLILGKVISRA